LFLLDLKHFVLPTLYIALNAIQMYNLRSYKHKGKGSGHNVSAVYPTFSLISNKQHMPIHVPVHMADKGVHRTGLLSGTKHVGWFSPLRLE